MLISHPISSDGIIAVKHQTYLETQKNIQMKQKKNKQENPGNPHLNDAVLKEVLELQTTTINHFLTSLVEDEKHSFVKKTIRDIVEDRGFKNISLGENDNQFCTLLAKFLMQEDHHTGFMLWGQSGCGKTVRLTAAEWILEYAKELAPVLPLSVSSISAYDLVFPYASMKTFEELCNEEYLILDDLGCERGSGENVQFAQSLIGELLIKRYDAMRPTIIASIFDVHNLGITYGHKVADIIRESYYVTELTTNFRREIINTFSE